MAELRWPTVDGPGPERAQGALFDADELAGHHVGSGEFRGMEFLHVRARTIINRIPAAAQLPFSHTINVYRGCSHACSYCLAGGTPILMGDGRTRPISDLRPGDQVYGTERQGAYRRLVLTPVLDHWATTKPAHRVRLADGTVLMASGDHRFLTQRGWKHVTGTEAGRDRRPHLTPNDRLQAIKTSADLRVVSVEPLDLDLPMYDITTATGDFIANGVISHNCFARPTHDYLGLGIGEDFQRKIVVKVNAVELLRSELAARRWPGHHIAMGTNTDPYQRCEGKYHLTRGVIEVLAERANPFSILTKSTLILRDLDLLVDAARHTDVRVNLSIGTLDEDVWKLTEPGTPALRLRVEAVRKLRRAGLDCGVLVAPVLPGLSDRPDQLAAVIDACVAAGATSMSAVPLHLRPGVREHYLGWLERVRPDLLGEHRQRYVKSYLPQPERQALATTIRRLVDESTARHRPPGPATTWASAREAREVPPTRLIEGGFTRRLREQMGGDAGRRRPEPADDGPQQLGLL